MNSQPRPNFFIVGAPKAGTTAMYEYLRVHPQICMASYKEPHYFADDLQGYARATTLNEYLGFFRQCNEATVAIGEGSVWYLRSKIAIANIRAFNPEARILAMLRNPVDLVRSFHTQALYSYIEEEQDLEAAWRLQDKRAAGECIPPGAQAIETLMYRDMARLGEQVQRLLQIFPANQVRLMLFEDFVSNTQKEYEQTLDFLGVDRDGRTSFPPVNEARGHKFPRLGRLLMQAPQPIVKTVRAVRHVTGLDPMSFVRKVREWNSVPKPKKGVSDEFRGELIDYFRSDVELLANIIDRDLSHWLQQ
ncbi:MAG: sulfotransferase [Pseudomonadota bacterium]